MDDMKNFIVPANTELFLKTTRHFVFVLESGGPVLSFYMKRLLSRSTGIAAHALAVKDNPGTHIFANCSFQKILNMIQCF